MVSWGASNTAQPAGQKRGYPAVFSVGVASPQVLCDVLGPAILEGSQGPSMCPEEGNKDGDWAGRHVP